MANSFRLAQARHVYGRLPDQQLIALAIESLVEGYDSPSLRMLAGALPDDDRIPRLFDCAAEELNLPFPSEQEASRVLASEVARDIISGRVSPYKGASIIWWELTTGRDVPRDVMDFVGLASEYEDQPGIQDECERDIVSAARRLIAAQSNEPGDRAR